MVQKERFRLLLCACFFSAFVLVYPAVAEVKVFEKKTVEQDPIKRARMENEQRWNDLPRKAQPAQDRRFTLPGEGKMTVEPGESDNDIDPFGKMKQEETAAQEASKRAARLLARKEIGKDGRFTAYDDGTVLDRRSGLMWAAKDNGADIHWQGARSYCENYREGGYTDWRMPTQDELAGLYDKAKGYTSVCGDEAHLTELIRLTCYWTWASDIRDSGASCFRFGGGGYRCWGPPSGAGFSRALPVRSGK
jgi:hypothetical protein